MKRTAKKVICIVSAILLAILFASNLNVKIAKADDVTELYSFEDLLMLASSPEGSYKLMADIDCTGKSWTPVDFAGSLDGNGHAILNLNVTQCGSTYGQTCGANYEMVDTYFAGFFGQLHNAHVTNLKVLGVNINIDTDKSVFAGGLVGNMENSAITGCRIEGHVEVATSGKIIGVGGIAGFGNGGIENCSVDAELVTIDKITDEKGEEYLGGAYGAGYIDLKNNTIKYQGAASDHGYVHIGGLVGQYIVYPEGKEYAGVLTGNSLSGKITFYEDNDEGNGICDSFIGEVCNWTFEQDDFNGDNFEINQLWYDDYYNEDTNSFLTITPHMCDTPNLDSNAVTASATENGYTQHTCSNCGYTYKDTYTKVLNNPEPTQEYSEPETQEPVKPKKSASTVLIVIIVVVVVVIVALIVLYLIAKSKRKKRALARKAKMMARRRELENMERSGQSQQRRTNASSQRPRKQRPSNRENDYNK